MKHVLAPAIILVLITSQAYAKSCLDRLTNQNWPEDRHEKVLKCNLDNISFGDERSHYGDTMCFGIKKTQSSDYHDTFYTALRFYAGKAGSLVDIVAVDSGGIVSDRDSSLELNGDIIKMAKKHYSFSHGTKWKTESVVNLRDQSLTFNIYDKKLWRYTKKLTAKYKCVLEL